MLFWAKRDATVAFITAVALAAVAVVTHRLLGHSWDLVLDTTGILIAVGLGLVVVILSDGLGSVALWFVFDDEFVAVFEAFIEYFEGQSTGAIIAGGVLAAAEELLFRGVVLEALHRSPEVPTAVAVSVAALAFGAFHVAPDRRLYPFAVWAVWEGVLLGGIYVGTGSLMVVVATHATHDIVGFTLFDRYRKREVRSPIPIEPKRE